MGAPSGREQTAGLATEAGRDVNQALGRPADAPHGHDILLQLMMRDHDSPMMKR
jgi:hypothetical protein